MPRPIVIAHRGASGYRPEHTLAAYDLAIDLGADFIEPDLVATRDGTLVARHENAMAVVDPASGSVIEATTDVADRREFASRKTTKSVDGKSITGWFTEDFSIDELRTLRARERLPLLRPDNVAYDGLFAIPTLEEIIELVKRRSGELGRQIGIYPETKHPTYFKAIGLPLERSLIELLHGSGSRGPDARVFIQSFEIGNLRELAKMTSLPLIQLIGDETPFDLTGAGGSLGARDMISPAGLRRIREYATGIGPSKHLIFQKEQSDAVVPTSLLNDAHEAGLLVHVWTFRNENQFLPGPLRLGSSPATRGDAEAELKIFFELGVDGVFSDFPDTAVSAREKFYSEADRGNRSGVDG